MHAIVLVGGQGTRLRPLTYDIPKPMLPIVERPIIARIVDWLSGFGVTGIVLSLGYRPDAFSAAFPSGSISGVELIYAVEPEPLDTAGAIAFAAGSAGVADERLLVVNGDILTDLDVASLVAFHEGHGGLATISLTPVAEPSAYGVVPTEENGRVLAFIEKPPAGSEPTDHINAGTYVLEPEAVSRIPTGRPSSIEREVFPILVEAGALFAQPGGAYWIDTGTPERFLEAQFDILSGARPTVVTGLGEEWRPGVRLAGAATLEGEVLEPAFLGADACVAAGAHIERAVLGAGVRVEAGAVVRNAVLLPGAVVCEGARVEDSIIGPWAEIGRHAVVARHSIVGARAVVGERETLDSARVPV